MCCTHLPYRGGHATFVELDLQMFQKRMILLFESKIGSARFYNYLALLGAFTL